MPSVARGISKSHFDWNFFNFLKIRLLFKVPNQALWDWRVFSLVLLHFLSIYRNFVWYESARGHSNNREVRKVTFSIEKFCQRGTLWQMVKIIPPSSTFLWGNFFRGSTIRKSTDSAFRICGSQRGTYDQKYSYRSSKSGQVGKSGFVPENTGCQKKIRRAQFLRKSLFLLRGFFKYHLKTSLRRNKPFSKLSAH